MRPAPSGERALGPLGKVKDVPQPPRRASNWDAGISPAALSSQSRPGLPRRGRMGRHAVWLEPSRGFAARPEGPLPRGGGSRLPRPHRLVPLPGLPRVQAICHGAQGPLERQVRAGRPPAQRLEGRRPCTHTPPARLGQGMARPSGPPPHPSREGVHGRSPPVLQVLQGQDERLA